MKWLVISDKERWIHESCFKALLAFIKEKKITLAKVYSYEKALICAMCHDILKCLDKLGEDLVIEYNGIYFIITFDNKKIIITSDMKEIKVVHYINTDEGKWIFTPSVNVNLEVDIEKFIEFWRDKYDNKYDRKYSEKS